MRVEKRADSDTAPDLFRHYDIAGAAHATPDELNYAAAQSVMDLVAKRFIVREDGLALIEQAEKASIP